MKLVKVPIGAIGCDMLTPLSPYVAVALYGYLRARSAAPFVVRYLENLTSQELISNLAAGLGVMLVGESRAPGWIPSAILGSADGLRLVTKAKIIGAPSGAQIWCDLETPLSTVEHSDIAAYVEKWCDVVNPSFEGVGYIGSGLPSTPSQLYSLPFKGYWHSLSNVQPVANVDYMMIQLYPTMTLQLPTGPLQVDMDVVQQDKKSRAPTMIVENGDES